MDMAKDPSIDDPLAEEDGRMRKLQDKLNERHATLTTELETITASLARINRYFENPALAVEPEDTPKPPTKRKASAPRGDKETSKQVILDFLHEHAGQDLKAPDIVKVLEPKGIPAATIRTTLNKLAKGEEVTFNKETKQYRALKVEQPATA